MVKVFNVNYNGRRFCLGLPSPEGWLLGLIEMVRPNFRQEVVAGGLSRPRSSET